MKQSFSIVVPVHNKENYIKQTLSSILEQTYSNFELILVDDGSIDSSSSVCDEYALKDSRIKVIHQENGGVSFARNTGIKAATKDLVAFIDADDIWDKNYLLNMNDLIENFPQVDIYSSKYVPIQNGEIGFSENYFPLQGKFVLFDLIERCAEKVRFPIHSSSVIIKKKAIEKAGYFDERIAVFEDYDLFVRIALHSKVAYLNTQPLSFYNLDVPVESKARGAMPDLNKHWITYFEKFKNETKNNPNLKLLIDRAILTQLMNYNRQTEYRKKIKNILKQVNRKHFALKYKLIYFTPAFLGSLLLNSYQYLVKNLLHKR